MSQQSVLFSLLLLDVAFLSFPELELYLQTDEDPEQCMPLLGECNNDPST